MEEKKDNMADGMQVVGLAIESAGEQKGRDSTVL